MRVAIFGCGAVGGQLARRLAIAGHELVLIDNRQAPPLAKELGAQATVGSRIDSSCDAAILATKWGSHSRLAARALRHCNLVISTGDSIQDTRQLLNLDRLAIERNATIAVGSGFSPGLTGILARQLATQLDVVQEVYIAKAGTAGPWCARQHHRALRSMSLDYRHGAWVPRPGGSGRELFWFPGSIGGRDCYRAALADPVLIVPLFPGVHRVTARMSATRRDRLTSRLPMLRAPHDDGGPGAVRVELRGLKGQAVEMLVGAVFADPSTATATVAELALDHLGQESDPGARSLAAMVDPKRFLREARELGLKSEQFVGSG